MNSLLIPQASPKPLNTNAGLILTKRVQAKDRSTVVLSYPASDAVAMRALAQSINLKGDRQPSLSLLTRRSMALYLEMLDTARTGHPMAWAAEIAALEQMATAHPTGKKPS